MMCRDQCPWGGPRAVAAALGVVGSTIRPPRPSMGPGLSSGVRGVFLFLSGAKVLSGIVSCKSLVGG